MSEKFRISIEIVGFSDGAIHVRHLHPEGPLDEFYGKYLYTNEARVIGNLLINSPVIEIGLVDTKSKFEFPQPRERTELEIARDQWNNRRNRLTPLVFEQHDSVCQHCGATENLTVDHIVPLAKGGTNELDNLQPLCKSCNSSKGAR